MTKIILDDIPFHPSLDALMRRLRVAPEGPFADDLRQFVDQAQAVARPKAMYKLGFIESRAGDEVVIDGVTFTSRVLGVNLEGAHRIFAYVVTCGVEIEAWARSRDDILQRYWAEAIQEMALHAASRAMYKHMIESYHPGRTSTMAPGSLPDWPLKEQRPLFALLGSVQQDIGVQLSDSLLMIPAKSVSGIRFPTEENFESCQLCPRTNCPGRRAPYDEKLYEKYRV